MGRLSKPALAERLPATTGPGARQKLDGRRQAENLAQNERIIALLEVQVAEQRRTNQLLEWVGGLVAQQGGRVTPEG